MLTETGLDDNFSDAVIFPSYFDVNRCDRSAANSIYERFGGALIAIKNDYKANVVDLSDYEDTEICCSYFYLTSSAKLCIVCVCIPPSARFDVVTRYIDAIRFIVSLLSASDLILINPIFTGSRGMLIVRISILLTPYPQLGLRLWIRSIHLVFSR